MIRKYFLFLILIPLFMSCRSQESREVVIYTSLDQTFSEPILTLYEKETGVTVKAVYDIEAAKTTGLVNRLVAEKPNPRADVFWSSEIVQTIYLKKEGVLAPYHSPSSTDIPDEFKDPESFWTGFGARARVIAYDPSIVDPDEVPKSIFDLAKAKWKGEVAIANPLFGTTATHAAVLFSHLGAQKAQEHFNSLKKNEVLIVSGNAHARDLVLRGNVKLCMTDTDDVVSAQDRGESISMVFPDGEGMGTLLIPNTIALVKGCPHPEEGKRLIDFILSRDTEQLLAKSASAQLPVRKGIIPRKEVEEILTSKIMGVDFEKAYEKRDEVISFIKNEFLR
jgi:iron(III) transport system substrate-binding protein